MSADLIDIEYDIHCCRTDLNDLSRRLATGTDPLLRAALMAVQTALQSLELAETLAAPVVAEARQAARLDVACATTEDVPF